MYTRNNRAQQGPHGTSDRQREQQSMRWGAGERLERGARVELGEARDVGRGALRGDAQQLGVHEVLALEAGHQQARNRAPDQQLEGRVRDEQAAAHAPAVLDRRAYVLVAQLAAQGAAPKHQVTSCPVRCTLFAGSPSGTCAESNAPPHPDLGY